MAKIIPFPGSYRPEPPPAPLPADDSPQAIAARVARVEAKCSSLMLVMQMSAGIDPEPLRLVLGELA